jgi:hypothetical protein
MIVLLLGLLAFTSTYVRAADDATIEQGQVLDDTDEQAEILVDEIDEETRRQQEEADRLAAQLAKEERKKAAAQKKRTMESCLTMVRAFYAA